MTSIQITLQDVNGDPFTSGGNINITTGTTEGGVFEESGSPSLSSVETGDTIEIGGLVYNYDYLGTHLVRGDASQPAAYIRIVGPLPAGATLTVGTTYAVDLTGEPGDPDYPNLANGNTKGKVADLDTTTPVQFPGYVCFTPGALIETPQGPRAVETLRIGDLCTTKDHGPKAIRWISRRVVVFDNDLEDAKPIQIKAGALAPGLPNADLVISPQHRIVFRDLRRPQNDEVFVPARALARMPLARAMQGKKSIEYIHFALDQHEVVFANGVLTESCYLGPIVLEGIPLSERASLKATFPTIEFDPGRGFGPPARPVVKVQEANKLLDKRLLVYRLAPGHQTERQTAAVVRNVFDPPPVSPDPCIAVCR